MKSGKPELVPELAAKLFAGSDDLVISNEGLCFSDLSFLAPFDFDMRCLVFFRPQVEFHVAAYMQKVSRGKTVQHDVNAFTLERHKAGECDWLKCAERLEWIFPQLTVHWYPAVMRDQGVVKAAFDWLGIPTPAIDVPRINVTKKIEIDPIIAAQVREETRNSNVELLRRYCPDLSPEKEL